MYLMYNGASNLKFCASYKVVGPVCSYDARNGREPIEVQMDFFMTCIASKLVP